MEKLDQKDKKILEVINNNGRASVTEIARKTRIPRDSVHYRLQRLIKSKVIRFFHTAIDHRKLGYPIFTFVNFVLYNFNEETEKRFYNYLINLKKVIYVTKTTGKWDCTIAIAAKDLEQFDSVLRGIRKRFSSIIKDFETASIIKEIKYDYMVDLIE